MKRQIIPTGKFALRFASGVQFVDGARNGEFLVHRQTGGGGGYRISHLPTGLAIGTGFRKFRKAYEFAGAVNALPYSWPSMKGADFTDEVRRQIYALIERYGAALPTNRSVSDQHRRPMLNGYRTQ